MTTPLDLFSGPSARANNDAANKIREAFLTTLPGAPERPEDTRFTALHSGLHSTVGGLCAEADSFTLIQKAGRAYNYDFDAVFQTGGTVVKIVKLEFKHNATEITDLPQFLSLGANALPFSVLYAAFYYDKYLAAYVATDPGITEPIPDRATYLSKIYNNNYDSLPFFRQLYDRESMAKTAKSKIVNTSIAEYLGVHGMSIDKAVISDALWKRQEGKKFLLWNCRQFNIRELTQEDLTITEFVRVHRGNTLIVKSATQHFGLLLRWKNHKGILFPAWQIKLLKSEESKAAAASSRKAARASKKASQKAEKEAAQASKKASQKAEKEAAQASKKASQKAEKEAAQASKKAEKAAAKKV
jgi:hypothetical protein